jgi:hypothetical protein
LNDLLIGQHRVWSDVFHAHDRYRVPTRQKVTGVTKDPSRPL